MIFAWCRGQPHKPATHQAGIAAVQVGAGIACRVRFAPLWRGTGIAEHVVVGVERVDVGTPFGEFGIERETKQATIPAVIDICAQVGEDFRFGVVDAFENEDFPRLLGDEDAAIGRRRRTLVGCSRPGNTTVSWKPGGSAGSAVALAARSSRPRQESAKARIKRGPSSCSSAACRLALRWR